MNLRNNILSVADDLDAFGYTGIYRYLEIYLTRGTNPADAGNQILRNAGKRFENFTSSFGFANNLLNKHKIRFDILEGFFRNYKIL